MENELVDQEREGDLRGGLYQRHVNSVNAKLS